MGGRGSAGGTRSTYRGDSTSLFRQQMQQGDGGGSGGGGGNTSNRNGNNRSSNSGGIQDGGGNGGGGGGSVTDTTDTDNQALPADADLEALFEQSDDFDALQARFAANSNPDLYQKAYDRAFTRWIQSQTRTEPGSAALPLRKKADNTRETAEQIQADIETVNRNFRTSNGEWDINCQRCSNAVELRARGYDVKAQPVTSGVLKKTYIGSGNFIGNGASVDQIARQWVDADGIPKNNFDYETNQKLSRANAVKQMEDEIVSWGEGARGFIYVTWMKKEGGSAHIWNVEVRNGQPFYVDGQTGQIGADRNDWKDSFSPSGWRGVMRVDNLEPRVSTTLSSSAALSWVAERSSDEINAPTSTATIARLAAIFPISPENTAKRNAFFVAWRAVYRGNDTSPPSFVNTPELLDAFNQGLAWARRPD